MDTFTKWLCDCIQFLSQVHWVISMKARASGLHVLVWFTSSGGTRICVGEGKVPHARGQQPGPSTVMMRRPKHCKRWSQNFLASYAFNILGVSWKNLKIVDINWRKFENFAFLLEAIWKFWAYIEKCFLPSWEIKQGNCWGDLSLFGIISI